MAVEIKYVVVRKGEEKMTFASKKDADAYDKMLDMAEVFSDWLSEGPVALDEQQREAFGLFLAENKDAVQHIVKTSKMPEGVKAEANHASARAEADSADPVEVSEQQPTDVQASADELDEETAEGASANASKRKSARTPKAA